MSRRLEKINELLQQELAKVIQEKAETKGGLFTIIEADVSPDLHQAEVWVSHFGPNQDENWQKLVNSRSEIQFELGKRLRQIKYVPKIKFKLDKSGEKADRINKLIEKAK